MITYKELHRQLMYNPWTGDFYWKVLKCNIKPGIIAGGDSNGYITIRINEKPYSAHRLAWFYYYGYWPENEIDHRDQVRHHNWIKNLREASKTCNRRNTGNRKDNKSGVKGVYLFKNGKYSYWKAQICINKKVIGLGQYEDFDEAVCARLAGEQCVNWEGCDSCSPSFKYVKENIQN